MAGGGGFGCATALPLPGGVVGVAGCPAAGGAGEGVPAVAAPGGFDGDGGVCAAPAPVAGWLAGFDCGPELQAARTRARSSRFMRSPEVDERAAIGSTPACLTASRPSRARRSSRARCG